MRFRPQLIVRPGIVLQPDDPSRGCSMAMDGAGDQPSRRSDHAQQRAGHGRPVGSALQDAQRAGRNDVFVQPADGRLVVRGPRGREHVFEADGQIVTSLNRSDAAHRAKFSRGERMPDTDEEFNRFKGLIHE